jgi:hippurate hydrolase
MAGTTAAHGFAMPPGRPMAIGLRADMDALPMTEHNDFAWKSGKPA